MKNLFCLTFISFALLCGCSTDRHLNQKHGGLVILKAVYGVNNTTVDVTSAVRSLVDGDAVRLKPKWDLGSVDPAFGTVKNVTIAYRYNSRIQLATFSQNDEIILPLPGATAGFSDLAGDWTMGGPYNEGKPCRIVQSDHHLTFINENHDESRGVLKNENEVVALDWEGGLVGKLNGHNTRIDWQNGTWWTKGQ